MPRKRALTILAVLLACCATICAQQAPLSDRIVAYDIAARYDAKSHSVDATETLTYVNRSGQPLDRFPFHLYLNAFQPKSTFVHELKGAEASEVSSKLDGANEIKSIVVDGIGDLTAKIRYIQPDDGNTDDRTVFEVPLPHPVAPGASVTFRIAFKATFPEVIARTGYKHDFLLAGQWFPKVGVWWKGQWNCHQFHRNTEFFADFGTYDVAITLPKNFIIGATGTEVSDKPNKDGTRTVRFHAEDVHDFAWTASPEFKVVDARVTLSTGPVRVRLLMQPPHMKTTARYLQALMGTMHKFDEWYGPYPYPQITVVDPPPGGMEAGGMEYPTFITADTTWWMLRSLRFPEEVVEHEYGHQYWYGMVATNEFEEAWLDEGINSYSQVKVMDALYGVETSFVNSRLATTGDRDLQRFEYVHTNNLDPLERPGWQYYSENSYGGTSYGKTSSMLLTLEALIGEQKVQHALRVYFQRYRFKHPDAKDFINTFDEAAGQDLMWFWNQAIFGTQKFDYAVSSLESTLESWSKKPRESNYRNEVVVQRKGEFVFPVTLEVRFDDGTTTREHWGGRDRWHRFAWTKKAKVVSAEIDPDHQIVLDTDYFNNSKTVAADRHATRKLGMYWTILSQWFAQVLSWLA